jgi:hypothetical protein
MIEEIDRMISEYMNAFRNADADRHLEIVEWMDNISLKIYNFENKCFKIIKS